MVSRSKPECTQKGPSAWPLTSLCCSALCRQCGGSSSRSPSTPSKASSTLILPSKDNPWTPGKKKSEPGTPKKRSKDALYNSTDDDDDEISWSDDDADHDGAAEVPASKTTTPTRPRSKSKTPSPLKKHKREDSAYDNNLGGLNGDSKGSSPGKRAPAQKWTAGRFNDDSLRDFRGLAWLTEPTSSAATLLTHVQRRSSSYLVRCTKSRSRMRLRSGNALG